MKYVQESLKEFNDYKFFLFEEESGDNKENLKSKEKDGLAVVDKVFKDFEEFKKEAKGQVLKFKEFWEENQKTKKLFSESGDIYKMFGKDFVVGVLKLQPEIRSDGSLEGGIGASPEGDEEIIEGKEVLTEAEASEVKEPIEEEPKQDPDLDLGLDKESGTESEPEPESSLEPENVDLKSPGTYLVVYDISGGEKEEIFRCGSNNVVKAFNAFYNDTFKGSMKSIIAKYKEQKEIEKKEAEKTEKQRAEREKESKIQKFLS